MSSNYYLTRVVNRCVRYTKNFVLPGIGWIALSDSVSLEEKNMYRFIIFLVAEQIKSRGYFSVLFHQYTTLSMYLCHLVAVVKLYYSMAFEAQHFIHDEFTNNT